jgi:hypothetical protein
MAWLLIDPFERFTETIKLLDLCNGVLPLHRYGACPETKMVFLETMLFLAMDIYVQHLFQQKSCYLERQIVYYWPYCKKYSLKQRWKRSISSVLYHGWV